MKILYIHDYENWAIHNVGKLWLDNNDIEVQYINFNSIKSCNNFGTFDYVIFGFSTLWVKMQYMGENAIIVFHDPVEVFREKNISQYKNKKIIVASSEVHELLKQRNIFSTIIPTTTLLEYRDELFCNEEAKIISINSGDKRKNNDQLRKFFKYYNFEFNLKIGLHIKSIEEYTKCLDDSNIYICMSVYEGGPLTAFDAMARGCIVLSTKVGQLTELIVDEYNGFLLDKEEDFYEKLNWIKNNKDWLLNARNNSIKTLKEKRNKESIKQKIKQYFL